MGRVPTETEWDENCPDKPAKTVTNVEASRRTTGQDAILYGKPLKDITRKDIKIKTH